MPFEPKHDAIVTDAQGREHTIDFVIAPTTKSGYDMPAILTSNSAYSTAMACMRRRWWAYEAPSGVDVPDTAPGTLVTQSRGWERQRLSLPLSTGSWCHHVAQGLLIIASRGVLGHLWDEVLGEAQDEATNALNGRRRASAGCSTADWIQACVFGYKREAHDRGLDLGLSMDGQQPEEKFVERTIAEQSALLEAFGWAYQRVRVPRLIEEYEILGIEQEEYTLLSGDVGLQSRCDAVLRRRVDQRLFIYNLKTSGNPDKRWHDQFEVDSQLMTETLAVERRLGERVYGVVIDGFDKGVRVEMDFNTLKERPKDGSEKWYGQRSRLIYGYKCEDIPGRPTLYDYEGTTRKGWGKFAVWEEDFKASSRGTPKCNHSEFMTCAQCGRDNTGSVEYWVNWLPIEQVEAAFITLPAIMRSDRAVESAVRQIVAVEQDIRDKRHAVEQAHNQSGMLDVKFPQSFRACIYPNRCGFFALCHEGGADDPSSHGFAPRKSNHPALETE